MGQGKVKMERLGLDSAPTTVRIIGCPNSCARPHTADIGFVGRRSGRYDVFVGRLRGDRLADRYAEEMPFDELVSALTSLLLEWEQKRLADETLGDFYQRLYGLPYQRRLVTETEQPALSP